jgi:hypothetical protein
LTSCHRQASVLAVSLLMVDSCCLDMKTLFSLIFVCERLLQDEVGVVFELLNQKARVFLVLIALTR